MLPAFASAQARLGASALSRLANASARVLPGTSTVGGIFTRRIVDVQLGGSGFVGRNADFVCAPVDATANSIDEGTQLQIGTDTWQVALRTDDFELGQTILDLKKP